MDDNVKKFYTANRADDVLELAIGEFESVVILGWDKNDNLDARATLDMNKKESLYLCQLFIHKMMNGDFDIPEDDVV